MIKIKISRALISITCDLCFVGLIVRIQDFLAIDVLLFELLIVQDLPLVGISMTFVVVVELDGCNRLILFERFFDHIEVLLDADFLVIIEFAEHGLVLVLVPKRELGSELVEEVVVLLLELPLEFAIPVNG